MKRVVDNPVPPGGDIDAVLGAFFKGEMPRPWPAFQPPRGRILPFRPAKPSRFARGSRLALAASVLLLLLCGWLLSDKFPGPAPRPEAPSLLGPGGARKPLLPDDLGPDFKPAPGKVKSKLSLEQDADGTGIRIDVVEDPSSK